MLLAITVSGALLPPQVIYQGKTGCHPQITFSAKWNVTHSDSHWSNEATMVEYLEQVIIPYVTEMQIKLDLADDHTALAILTYFLLIVAEVFWQSYKQAHNIHQVFIPAGCTGM